MKQAIYPWDSDDITKLQDALTRQQINLWNLLDESFTNVEPEQDAGGWFYGYKLLARVPSTTWMVSPSFPSAVWENDKIVASQVPEEWHDIGIHAVKRPEFLEHWLSIYRHRHEILVACKVALYGVTVIETEKGYRAHKAQIVEVMNEYR